MRKTICALLLAFLFAAGMHAQDFKKQVIYQIVTDRFYDGDTSNDNLPEALVYSTPRTRTGKRTGAATWPAFSISFPTSRAWAPRPSGSLPW
jgi:hypothetical protein